MTAKFNLHEQFFTSALTTRMLAGATFSFILIAIFLAGVNDPHPDWPRYWMARPLIIVPIAGAIGGAFYDFMHLLRYQGGIKKLLGIILGIIGFLVILWLGSVYGLAGTLWD